MSLQPVRFIHAADLHLDTAFPGLARQVSSGLARRLHDATFVALDRLIALCEKEKPDFLILAGDVWNQEDLSLRAQLAVRNACESLGKLGIRVFMAHGNHDPLTSRFQALEWPENVTVFQDKVEAFPVFREGYPQDIIAIVHGISHSSPRESRNLASWFQRIDGNCPQIGVLHTSLGVEDGEAIYAPASLTDLASSGLDYWALGHVHGFAVMKEEPLSIYPGAIQGLHIGESGPHGCVVVSLTPEVDDKGQWIGVTPEYRFEPLAPVGWKILEIDLERPTSQNAALQNPDEESGAKAEEDTAEASDNSFSDELSDSFSDTPDTLSRLERTLREKLLDMAAEGWNGCEGLIVRLRLTGRTALDSELRRTIVQAELMEALQDCGGTSAFGDVEVWIKDIEVETRPLFDREHAASREDLLGELLRRADMWRSNEKMFIDRADEALSDLFVRGRLRKGLSQPHKEDLYQLLDEAERLCADFLDNND